MAIGTSQAFRTQNFRLLGNFYDKNNVIGSKGYYLNSVGDGVEWRADINEGTGILTGGVISATIGGTTFNITAGTGQILSKALINDEVIVTNKRVSWNAQSNISLTYRTTHQFSYIYIDENGVLQQQNSSFTDAEYRNKIIIGIICHIDYSTINLVTNKQNVAYNDATRMYELISCFGPIKQSGLSISAYSTDLRITRASGAVFLLGSNYSTDQFVPDTTELTAANPALLCRVSRNGSGGFVFDVNSGSYYTSIDPTKYDNGSGTLQTVNNNQWTIQRLYFFPNNPNDVIVYYGRAVYNSYTDASAGLSTESFSEATITAENAVFLGYLIVRGGATNLSTSADATFFQSGAFRNIGTGGGGGGGAAATNLDDLGDVAISSPSDSQFLIYDNGTSLWKNASLTASSPITFTGVGTSLSLSVSDNAISFAKIQQISTSRVLGRISSGTGNIEELTGANIATIIGSNFVTNATNATNLIGGVAGVIPYQSGIGTTAFTSAGTVGQVLLSGGTGAPTWASQNTLSVSSAATLTTTRTLWGQNFNGSADVTGSLSSVGNITGSSAITIAAGGSNQNITLTPSGTGYTLLNGNVGIGTTIPNAKLEITSTGDVAYLILNTSSTVNKRTRLQFTQNDNNGLELGTDYGVNNENNFYFYDRVNNHTFAFFSNSKTWINGDLGVGLTNPSNKLVVLGAASIGSATYNTAAPTNGLLVQGNVGIGTTSPSTLLNVYKASGDSILTLDNTGNGNSSGINFNRERLSGPGVNAASIFVDSDTSSNNAFLYIQAQSASANAGVTSALTANNGVRLLLRGGYGIFSIENGASETFRIDNNGNVGIGVASPSYKLDVAGRISYSGVIGEGADATLSSAGTVLLHGNSSTWTEQRFYTSGNQVVTINTSGNVGIGTSTIFAKLVVSNGSGENIEFNPGNSTWNGTVIESINRVSPTTRPDLILYTGAASNGSVKIVTNNNERMRIASDGNVGIGTNNPSQLLHLSSTGTAKLKITADTDNVTETEIAGIELSQDGGITTGTFTLDDTNSLVIGVNSTTSPNIYLSTKSDGTTFTALTDAKVTILNGGNVGIGTTIPSQKLHVVGDLRVTGAFYDSNNDAGTSGQILKSTATGTDWVDISTLGVDGTGTTNYVTKWLDSNTITNSLIFDSGTNVGIGTATPSVLFHLEGGGANNIVSSLTSFFGDGNFKVGSINGTSTNSSGQIIGKIGSYYQFGNINSCIRFHRGGGATDGYMSFSTNGDTERVRIDSSGNVGIGTTSPASLLQIGTGTPTSSTGGLQFGDDTGTRIYRSASSTLTMGGTFAATTFSGSGASLTNIPAGQLSGTIPSGVLANSTVYIGTTAIALNRSSASQSLTGITSIDGSAATLTTTRTLWGQNFNGSANVTGSLSSVGDITGSSSITITAGGSNQNVTITPSGTGYTLLNGNVGIGTTVPVGKLDVNGAVHEKKYAIANTAATAQWVKIGRLYCTQEGKTFILKAYIHAGYNARNDQDFSVELFFKTSNSSSVNGNGFAANSWYYAYGFNTHDITPKWVANVAGVNATYYDLYLYLPQFTLGSHYSFSIVNGDASTYWTDSQATGQTDPGSGSSTVLVADKGFNFTLGNVGIGSIAPANKLNVLGSASIGSATYNTAAPTNGLLVEGNVAIGSTSGYTTGGNASLTIGSSPYVFSIGSSNNELMYTRRLSSGIYQLQTYNSANTGEIHLEPYGGNVGIGTTSASNTLDVNGTARIRSIAASGSTASIFLTTDANGVVISRTAAQVRSDIGAGTGSGTVTSITAGDGLSGGTITSSGTIAVDSTVVRTSGNQNIAGVKTFTGNYLSITGTNSNSTDQSAGSITSGLRLDAGEGFSIYGNQSFFGANLDAIILQMEDGNSTSGNTDGGFVFRGYSPTGTTPTASNWMVIKSGSLVGIGTTSPATTLQIGQLTPTGATSGLQFGDDTGTRIYRSASSTLTMGGTFIATTFSGSGASLTNLPAGQLSGTIPSGVLANSTVYIGTTAIALNRSSASQSLTGITSIDGSAVTVSGTTGQLLRFDNRIIAPNETSATYLQFGFTSWDNNNSTPYADYLHMRSYQDSSGGNDNLVMFRKDALGIRIWQQTYGSSTAYSSYKDVCWTDGSNTSGTWSINTTGSAATLTTTRTLWGQNFNGSANVTGSLTSVGNITGSSAITITAGGSNQNITLTPSGSGYTLLNGHVGIGTTVPTSPLHICFDGSVFPSQNVARIVSLSYSGITGAHNWALRGVYQYSAGVANNASGGDLDLIKSLDRNTILATKTDGTALGNVGIGVTAPANTLVVLGAASIGSATYNTAAPTNGLLVEGNVGIGTTSPGGKLDVALTYANLTASSFGLDLKVTELSGGWARSHRIYNTNYTTATSFFGMLGGVSSVDYAYWTLDNPASVDTTGYNSTKGIFLLTTGNVGIGVTNPSQKLHVAGSLRVTGAFYDSNNDAGTSGQILKSTATGTDWVDISSLGVDGTGTTNYITKWSDSNTITNSLLFDDGTKVGIGTASPTTKLDIRSVSANQIGLQIVANSTTGQSFGARIYAGTNSSDYAFTIFNASDSANLFHVRGDGNVGIGTTVPAQKLQVVGDLGFVGGVSSRMLSAYTNLTNGEDWANSPISIRERDLVNSTQSIDKYSPNLNFHWGNRASKSLWMDSNGILNWGEYDTNGIPAADGYFKTGDINFISTLKFNGVNVIYNTSTDVYVNARVIRNDSASVQDGMYIGYASTGTTAAHIRFFANGTNERMRIQASDGNVGIGTTAPSSRLHLHGTAPTILTFSSASYPVTDYNTTLGVDSSARGFLIFGNNAVNEIRAGRTVAGGFLDFYTNNTVGQTTTTSDGNFVMRMAANGNVGIGLTTPGAKLEVLGSSPSYPASSGTTQTGHIARFTNNGSNLILDIGGNGGNGNWLQSTNKTDLSLTYPLLLNPNGGSVGIGTTNPATLLQIGTGTPTAATSGIQFGSDTGARLYRDTTTRIRTSGDLSVAGYIQTSNNNIYPNDYTGNLLLNVGNSAQNAWINGISISPGGNVAVYNNLTAVGLISTGSATTEDAIKTTNGRLQLGHHNSGSGVWFDTSGTARYWFAGLSGNNFRIYRGADYLTITDSGNVGINAGAPTEKLHVEGNIKVNGDYGIGAENTGGATHVTYCGGGQFHTSSSSTVGYLKITLPQSWTNTMMQFYVDVFEYSTGKTKTFCFSGYNYAPSTNWVNVSAYLLTDDDTDTYTARFGHDGTKCAIYVSKSAGSASDWAYVQVTVRDFHAGFQNYTLTNWVSGWDVSFTATLGTITATRSISRSLNITNISGTTNYVSKFTAANNLGDSLIYSASTKVGIGTTAPNGLLTLVGAGSDNTYSGILRVADTSTNKWGGIGFPDVQGTTTAANNYYLIGRGASYNDRTLSFHIPSAADYGSGNQPFFGFYSSGSVLLSSIESNTGNSYIKGNLGLGITNPANKLVVIGAASIGSATYNTAAPTNGLLVEGNVGIGGTSPDALLHVATGHIHVGNATAFDNTGSWNKTILIDGTSHGRLRIRATAYAPGNNNINEAYLWVDNSTTPYSGLYADYGFRLQTGSGSIILSPASNVGIGTSSPAVLLHIGGSSQTTAAYGLRFGLDSNANLYRSASTTIKTDGSLVVGGSLTELSALKYKENIAPISNILDKVCQIQPISYNKKGKVEKEYGVIAEEVNELFPELISRNADGDIDSVNYSRLTVLLIQAVKELKAEVEKLKNK